jgi:hypothetical protein
MYAKATKRPWRGKQSKQGKNEEIPQPRPPGQIVSVDQLVSPTPGLIAQMTGTLTTSDTGTQPCTSINSLDLAMFASKRRRQLLKKLLKANEHLRL